MESRLPVTIALALCVVVGIVLGACPFAQASVITFNSSTDLDTYFEPDKASFSYGWTSSGGVGGSGAITPPNKGEAGTFDNGGYGWSVGDTIDLSMDFYFDRDEQNEKKETLRLGVVGGLGDGFKNPQVRGEVKSDDKKGNGKIKLSARVNGGKTEVKKLYLADDNWYRLAVAATLESTTDVSVLVQLFDIGSDGTGTPAQVNGDVTQSGATNLASDASVFSGFQGRKDSGAAALDNFQTALVPEPSTLVMAFLTLGIGAAAAVRYRRRIRKGRANL